MNPVAIIKAKIDNMGYPIEREALARIAAERVRKGWDTTFTYGRVVFTVSREGIVHLYGLDSGHRLLFATSLFMRDVWRRGHWTRLLAPIKDPTIEKLACRFGWKFSRMDPFGFSWYQITRS